MTRQGAPAPILTEDAPLSALIARIWRDHVRRRWPWLALAMACAAAVAGLSALLAQQLEPAVDRLLVKKDPHALVIIPLSIAGLAIARAAAQIAQAAIVNRVGHGVVGDVQVRLFSTMIRADLARLRSAHTGSYVASVLFDANLIRQAFTDGVINWTQHSLTVVALLILMAVYDPLLAGMALLAAPAAALIMRRFSRRTRKAARGAMAETSNLSTAIMESLDGVKIVKIDGREAYEEARVAAVVAKRQRHVVSGANAKAFATPTTEAATMIVTALIFAFAGWRARTSGMSVGEMTLFVAALLTASQSLRQLANLQTVMAEGLTAARRLFSALDVRPEVREPASPRPIPQGGVAIAFEAVGFSYGGGAPALARVDLVARAGETIALVGPSGGGKSTILNLIPRFYDVSEGAVRINGLDVREASIAALRAKIALVTQEPFLFDDAIAANIAYGRPGAGREEIEAAARAAAAHDFIAALPAGYDTPVGEAGARLSGGQRQRIAIARAFLKDAPLLLLDEATSALDTESEARVQEALERLMAGRTTLMIAHRLSTVMNADRIYVIEAGRVVEQGGHAELTSAGGLYARLARSQDLTGAVPAARRGGRRRTPSGTA